MCKKNKKQENSRLTSYFEVHKLPPGEVDFAGSNLPKCILVLVGTFSCAKIDSRKARERESAKSDGNRRAIGTLNCCAVSMNGRRGEEGRHLLTTYLRPRLVQSWKSRVRFEVKHKTKNEIETLTQARVLTGQRVRAKSQPDFLTTHGDNKRGT